VNEVVFVRTRGDCSYQNEVPRLDGYPPSLINSEDIPVAPSPLRALEDSILKNFPLPRFVGSAWLTLNCAGGHSRPG
jgi:hypothetical protein